MYPFLLLSHTHMLTSPAALGDECSPLPMQPIVVGYDHEWLSVSPLTLPAWVSPPFITAHLNPSLFNYNSTVAHSHTAWHNKDGPSSSQTRCLSLQEKLLFEPYAMRKTVTYLVVAPDTSSLSPILRKFFRDLSIMFKV